MMVHGLGVKNSPPATKYNLVIGVETSCFQYRAGLRFVALRSFRVVTLIVWQAESALRVGVPNTLRSHCRPRTFVLNGAISGVYRWIPA